MTVVGQAAPAVLAIGCPQSMAFFDDAGIAAVVFRRDRQHGVRVVQPILETRHRVGNVNPQIVIVMRQVADMQLMELQAVTGQFLQGDFAVSG